MAVIVYRAIVIVRAVIVFRAIIILYWTIVAKMVESEDMSEGLAKLKFRDGCKEKLLTEIYNKLGLSYANLNLS